MKKALLILLTAAVFFISGCSDRVRRDNPYDPSAENFYGMRWDSATGELVRDPNGIVLFHGNLSGSAPINDSLTRVTLSASVKSGMGIIGDGICFNQTNSMISLVDGSIYFLSGEIVNSFTLSIWMKGECFNSTNSQIICDFCSFQFYIGTNKKVQLSPQNISSKTVFSNNKWYLLNIIYDMSQLQMHLYVNGILENTYTYLEPLQSIYYYPIILGSHYAWGGMNGFKGTMDEVLILPYAVPEKTIKAYYDLVKSKI